MSTGLQVGTASISKWSLVISVIGSGPRLRYINTHPYRGNRSVTAFFESMELLRSSCKSRKALGVQVKSITLGSPTKILGSWGSTGT